MSLIKNKIDHRQFEIFCGTGGVGKTTLATSRAIYLAKQGIKVLLITIDPSLRLKELLHLNENCRGNIEIINLSDIVNYKEQGQEQETEENNLNNDKDKDIKFHALLMTPKLSIIRALQYSRCEDYIDPERIKSNKIVTSLTEPLGGMGEILAPMEIQLHYNSKNYDTIIVDTPPGKHFIDFLDSSQKIAKFFDQRFIEIFQNLRRNIDNIYSNYSNSSNFGKSFGKSKIKDFLSFPIQNVINRGIKSILHYLEEVTGKIFIHDFIEAIGLIYQIKSPFIKSMEINKYLTDANYTNWFFVTSAEHDKMKEISNMQASMNSFAANRFVIINKCLREELELLSKQMVNENNKETSFNESENESENRLQKHYLALQKIKEALSMKENALKDYAEKNFTKVLEFKEAITSSTKEQLTMLSKEWE